MQSKLLPLFPLQVVVFPRTQLPLHIFEDRYKELIGECLAERSEFGLILETEEGLREIGTSTAVLEVIHTFDDGRMNVLVEGHDRFRVARLTEGRSFRTAEFETIGDDDEEPTEGDVAGVMEIYRRLVAVAEAEQIDEPDLDSSTLSFQLASRVDFGHELKQELLELRSEPKRLRRLAELLERAVAGLTREAEVRERASGNGKVTPHPD
jgi:Lon protease-like protein